MQMLTEVLAKNGEAHGATRGRGPRPATARIKRAPHVRTASGRTFRTLSVVDRVTRECLSIEVDVSITGTRVVAGKAAREP